MDKSPPNVMSTGGSPIEIMDLGSLDMPRNSQGEALKQALLRGVTEGVTRPPPPSYSP